MSDSEIKEDIQHHDNGPLRRTMTTVTLTPEQFESLYMQPRNARMGGLAPMFGNPTPLGISSFLLALMPLSMDLLNFQGASAASSTAMLGAFYGCAGIGLYLACIMEWIVGNTFPCVVFGTFGGFWISYGVIVQPTFGLAAAFAQAADASNGITAASAGAATVGYNAGLGMYFVVWGIMCIIYFLAALRTNIPFAMIFLTLIFTFELIGAAYFHTGQGNTGLATKEFKVAGGFAFVTILAGWWVNISLLLASVGYPFSVPVVDLSTKILRRKENPQDRAMKQA